MGRHRYPGPTTPAGNHWSAAVAACATDVTMPSAAGGSAAQELTPCAVHWITSAQGRAVGGAQRLLAAKKSSQQTMVGQQRAFPGRIAAHQDGGWRSRMAEARVRPWRSGATGHDGGILSGRDLRSCFSRGMIDLVGFRRRNTCHHLGRNHLPLLDHASRDLGN